MLQPQTRLRNDSFLPRWIFFLAHLLAFRSCFNSGFVYRRQSDPTGFSLQGYRRGGVALQRRPPIFQRRHCGHQKNETGAGLDCAAVGCGHWPTLGIDWRRRWNFPEPGSALDALGEGERDFCGGCNFHSG